MNRVPGKKTAVAEHGPATDRPTTRPVKLRATDAAYDVIENMIATLELQPGAAILDKDLVERTGFGRTPVREALMRLVACGLIEQQPRRGMRVSEIRLAEHLTLIQTRRVLEQLIAAAAARRATPDQRRQIRECAVAMQHAAQAGDMIGYMRADQALDHLLHEACRNPYAVQAVIPMVIQCRRFWWAYKHEGDLEKGAAGHTALANGIADGDPATAMQGADTLMDYLESFARQIID